jgi:hypothetical protein
MQCQFKVNLCDHDIKVGKILGRGSFAQVYQGLWNDTGVAIKVIEYNSGARDAVDPLLEASLSRCAACLAFQAADCLREPLHCRNISHEGGLTF